MTQRLTIGLTGGIASGKSVVAQSFERLGVTLVDADLVSREIVAPGQPALAEIIERNDGNITRAAKDAGLDRKHLRRLLKKHNLHGDSAERDS